MPVASFLCRFYSFGFDEVLDLPIRTFFALAREGKRLQAEERYEELLISSVSMFKFQTFADLKAQYQKRMFKSSIETLPDAPPPIRPAINAASIQAKNAMISIFGPAKRRYGRSERHH